MKVITIGRNGDSNDIVVNDPKVSRNHLQIVMDDNGNVFVVDMASTNGTYVNGQRIAGQVALHQGDEVRIGSTVLPWMNYVQANQQQPQQPVSIPHTPVPQKNPKKNRTFIFVIVGAAVVLAAIGIGVALVISNSRKAEAEVEQLKADSIEAAQLKAEQEQKENEALQREVDSLWDVAKKAKTERERAAAKALAEKKTKEAAAKAKAAAEAQKAQQQAENSRKEAGKPAENKTTEAPKASGTTPKNDNKPETAPKNNPQSTTTTTGTTTTNPKPEPVVTKKAQENKEDVEKTFNQLLVEMTPDEARDFCTSTYDQFKIVVMGSNYKNLIKKKFFKSDKKTRKAIVKAMQEYLD